MEPWRRRARLQSNGGGGGGHAVALGGERLHGTSRAWACRDTPSHTHTHTLSHTCGQGYTEFIWKTEFLLLKIVVF